MLVGYIPVVLFDVPIFNPQTNSFLIPNIRMNIPGTVYFVLLLKKQMTFKQISK
jgi:hypothetical protein